MLRFGQGLCRDYILILCICIYTSIYIYIYICVCIHSGRTGFGLRVCVAHAPTLTLPCLFVVSYRNGILIPRFKGLIPRFKGLRFWCLGFVFSSQYSPKGPCTPCS